MALLSNLNRLFALLLLTSLVACRSTANEAAAKIDVDLLKKDFALLRSTLEEAHPGLYWYSSKPAMNAYFDSTYSLLTQNMSDGEFFNLLLPLIARIRCVHTSLGFAQPKRAQSLSVQRGLPLRLYFFQGKVYIQESFADSTQAGLEILAINQVPVQKLTAQFLRYFPADGYNQTYKYYLLDHGGFREAYAFLVGQPDAFVINAYDPVKKKLVRFRLKAKSQQELNKLAVARRKPRPHLDIDLAMKPGLRAAILTINTFEMSTDQFKDTIQAVFNSIQRNKVLGLIINLRRNGGGNNRNVPVLFSYLAQKPFRHLKKTEMLSQQFTNLKYVENPADFQRLRGTPTAEGTYSMNYLYPGTSLSNPVKTGGFNGKVVVLTSGATVSAASEFVALAHVHKRAALVGEETGGCYYGATGGRYLSLILPNSQLKVQIPTIRIYTDVPEDFTNQPRGRGVLPDFEIRPGINDVLTNKDIQLEAALRLIGKN